MQKGKGRRRRGGGKWSSGGHEGEGAAVREVGVSVRLGNGQFLLKNVMCDRLESELELELVCC